MPLRQQPMPSRCDIVFRCATVMDGSGRRRYVADVGVEGARIAGVGDLSATKASASVDAKGKVLAPGFIDTHAHDDSAMLSDPDMAMKVSQGVTSVIIGNCGVSLAPLTIDKPPPAPLNLIADPKHFVFPTMSAYFERLRAKPAAVNAACLVGHSTLRVGAMSDLNRVANDAEMNAMKERLAEGMRAGAVGFSSGLFYPPAKAATTEETAKLARVAGVAGGIYTAHIRSEDDDILPSLEEAFTIGREGGTPVVISHHKVAGAKNFGRTKETLAAIDAARRSQTVSFDVYPYVAASSWLTPDYLGFCSKVIITWSQPHPEMNGRDVSAIAREWGCDEKEAMRRMQPGGAAYFLMDEADVRRVLAHPQAMIGSDGIPEDAHPHPRLWGTFPRVLGHYARDLALFEMEDAVRRMTSLPAETFGFRDRGTIKSGAIADLVMFDPAKVIDTATFEHPKRPATGIELTLVAGTPVWQAGKTTGRHPGMLLKREAAGRL
jgi:N-acyl-D-amino-acid deacylase